MEPQTNADNGKTAAIVSYITIIGWLIAYLAMHQQNKTSLGGFHLRQTLLLFICAIIYQVIVLAITWVIPAIGLLLSFGYLAFLVLWVIGLIGAANGEEKPMPLIGEKAQELFKGI